MNFDHRRAQMGCHLDLPGVGGDEAATHPYAGIVQLRNEGFKRVVLADDVEAAFGGEFPPLRHQADRVRLGREHMPDHFVGRRHLEIERLSISSPSAAPCHRREYDDDLRADERLFRRAGLDRHHAARTGSGCRPPRALRRVATWSTLTPRRSGRTAISGLAESRSCQKRFKASRVDLDAPDPLLENGWLAGRARRRRDLAIDAFNPRTTAFARNWAIMALRCLRS